MSKKKESPLRYWPVVVVLAFFIFVLWTVCAFGAVVAPQLPPSPQDSVAYFYAPRAYIVEAGIVDGKLVIVYRQEQVTLNKRSGLVIVPVVTPPRIWQDVYVARGDSIVFERRIEGRIVPPETVPERIEWGTK